MKYYSLVKINLILSLVILLAGASCTKSKIKWNLVLHQHGQPDRILTELPNNIDKPFSFQSDENGINIRFSLQPDTQYAVFRAEAISLNDSARLYFSLRANYQSNVTPYNFNGEVKTSEVYRQSPHDVNAWISRGIALQAVPIIALKTASGFSVAVNGAPAFYNNFTSQSFSTNQKFADLSSGDNGQTPGLKPDTTQSINTGYNTDKTQIMAPGKVLAYYHKVTKTKAHIFEGIIFKSEATELNGLRKDVNHLAAVHFSNGKYTDYFGSMAFTTAFMNLRVNETGKSNLWVVPAVEYSNTQYCRDAFWISTMLDKTSAAECLKNELQEVNSYAEYPLITILWAYRSFCEGYPPATEKIKPYLDEIESRAKNNWFFSYTEKDGRLDFQYWGDVIAFEKDDVVTYNQGLFALALRAAQEMGLEVKSDPDKALANYRSMFNKALGFYPISLKKNTILGPDPVVPDLLSQVYFGSKMLDSSTIREHFNRMVNKSKTPYGFKIVSMPDGTYLPSEMYDVKNYVSQINREPYPDGTYFRGGSYFLYDNLMLINAYLHGIKEAHKELIWRVSLDFKISATTFECLNTKTGEPWKPNMGWNVAVYSIWRELASRGKADLTLFEEIDKITGNKNR